MIKYQCSPVSKTGEREVFYVRKSRLLFAVLAMLLLIPAALGEPARVVTRGGVLNLRKTPDNWNCSDFMVYFAYD